MIEVVDPPVDLFNWKRKYDYSFNAFKKLSPGFSEKGC